ncbi:hypothetical protein ES708_08000 [subsurface metagenome]
MTELEGLILYWKATLKAAWWLLEPATAAHIKSTIMHLEELQKIKGGEQ